jgi:hypothetical protein
MAGETTTGHQTWITVGAGAVLAGIGALLTVAAWRGTAAAAAKGLEPSTKWWWWVGVGLIVLGLSTVVAAVCHQFRHRLSWIWRVRLRSPLMLTTTPDAPSLDRGDDASLNVAGRPETRVLASPTVERVVGLEKDPASGEPIEWRPSFSQTMNMDGSSYSACSIIFSGKNASSREISLEEAYLVSGVTGNIVPIMVNVGKLTGYIELVPVTDINPVPPEAEIELVYELRPYLAEQDFMRLWGMVSLVVKYGGVEHRRTFDDETIARLFPRVQHVPPRPRVTKRLQG